jgi:hypothetical protein
MSLSYRDLLNTSCSMASMHETSIVIGLRHSLLFQCVVGCQVLFAAIVLLVGLVAHRICSATGALEKNKHQGCLKIV